MANPPSPLFGFLHVAWEGSDIYCAFLQMTSSDSAMGGFAPMGFSPSPIRHVDLPLGSEEPWTGMITVELVEVPMEHIQGFVSTIGSLT